VQPVQAAQPNYQEIMRQILSQLNQRKGTLFLRVLINLAPFILGFVILYAMSFFSGGEGEASESLNAAQLVTLFIGLGMIVLVAPAWIIIAGVIFKTERTIWIDSFFDSVTLTSSQSWKIARKLFWPSVLLNFGIFFRYYALAILATILLVGGVIYAAVATEGAFPPLLALAIIALTLIGLIVYSYIIQIRLRYVWFIFLDAYGSPDFSHRAIFTQMKALNARLKEGDLQKIVLTTLGVDAVGAVADTAIDGVSRGLSMFGGGGRMAGQLVGLVGSTMVAVVKDYSKQVSYYMFYRLARQALYGADDKGSVSLYADVTPQQSQPL
jgi:hypothetical protein